MAVRGDLPVRRGSRSEHSTSDRGGRSGFGAPARIVLPFNFETVTNPAELAGLVQTAMDSLVNQINTIFRERLDKIDTRGRMMSDTYSDEQGRPIRVRKSTTDKDVLVDDVFDTVNNDLDDVKDGPTFLKVTGVSVSNQVQPASIATDAVTTIKIAADAITQPKIGPLAVGTTEIAVDAVTQPKIGALAVGTTELAALAVTQPKIGAGAVGNAEIVAGADIDPSKVLISGFTNLDDWRHGADLTKIAGANLGNLSVPTGAVAALAIDSSKLGANSVIAGKMADNSLDAGSIFVPAIQNALGDYNADTGPSGESAWDAV